MFMRFLSPQRSVVVLAATAVLCALAPLAHAQTTLAENLVAPENGPDFDYYGQSVTTLPGTTQYNNIKFNFFAPGGATTPLAQGTLYAFSQEYLGTPGNLAAGSGLLGSSTGTSNGQYVFAPEFTLSGGTQYFFYTDQKFSVSGQLTQSYAGGDVYYANDIDRPTFVSLPADAAFRLTGTAVTPEASSLVNLAGALMAPGMVGMVAVRRRRKAKAAAA